MAADEAFGGFGDEADAPEAGADADLAALSSGPDSALPSNFNPIVARLRRAWIAEKTCPELLDFETDAVEGLKAALAAQQQIVDAAGTGGAGVPTLSGPAKAIYREDIERVRYLLAAYTRTRFAKISEQQFFLAASDAARARLAPQEDALLMRMVGARANHIDAAVLTHMPPRVQQGMQDGSGGGGIEDMSAACKPKLSRHVFVRVHEDMEVQADTSVAGDGSAAGGAGAGDEPVALMAGHDVVLQYSLVRSAVREGKVTIH